MMASTGRAGRPLRRVLIIVENLPVPFDRRVWQEAKALAAAGYRVSIICPTGPGAAARREVLDGIAIYRHPLPLEARGRLAYPLEYLAALFWQSLLAWRVFFARGFDVIHACNPPDTIFLVGGFFKLLFRKKFLFDHHDLCPELYLAKFGRRDGFYRLLLALERWTFRTAEVVISTNESYRRIAMDRGGKSPDKVFVVRSGPAIERMQIRPAQPDLRRGHRHLVGYVGVMGQQEGIEYLLQAARHIHHDLGRVDIQFTLVGSGPNLEPLKAMAQQLELEDFVNFTGRVSDDDLLDVLNTADVCVNPDECNEMNDKSTMNKIMEYMALAKPIVQFEVAEGRYSAQEASLYARPNDAVDLARRILELIDDPARREQMGRFGHARVIDQLAWHHQVPHLLAAYATLWSAPGRQSAAAPVEAAERR